MTGRADGNRQDNRQRGNAAQLLEKYKALARDSQLAGDRVQTEYYLQYAEHYFRVLGESRARFDEQRRGRGEDVDDGYDDEGDGLDGDMDDSELEQQQDRPQRQDQQPRRQYEERGERQQQRSDRNDRPQRDDRLQREDRSQRDDRQQRDDRPQPQRAARPDRVDSTERADYSARDEQPDEREERAESALRPTFAERTGGRLRSRARNDSGNDNPASGEEVEQRIAFDVIPPAIGPVDAPEAEGEEAPAPRRRTRRPRPDNDAGVAPAA